MEILKDVDRAIEAAKAAVKSHLEEKDKSICQSTKKVEATNGVTTVRSTQAPEPQRKLQPKAEQPTPMATKAAAIKVRAKRAKN